MYLTMQDLFRGQMTRPLRKISCVQIVQLNHLLQRSKCIDLFIWKHFQECNAVTDSKVIYMSVSLRQVKKEENMQYMKCKFKTG